MAEPKHRLSVDEYLEMERTADVRHEYVAGELFAMAGASKDHGRISTNLVRELSTALLTGACDVFSADMKVRIGAADAFVYPDLVVACDPTDHEDSHYVLRPHAVFEILSPTTAPYDRGKKLEMYASLPSLRAYVIVDTERRSVHRFTRREDGDFALTTLGADDVLELPSLDVRVPVEAIYARTDIE